MELSKFSGGSSFWAYFIRCFLAGTNHLLSFTMPLFHFWLEGSLKKISFQQNKVHRRSYNKSSCYKSACCVFGWCDVWFSGWVSTLPNFLPGWGQCWCVCPDSCPCIHPDHQLDGGWSHGSSDQVRPRGQFPKNDMYCSIFIKRKR